MSDPGPRYVTSGLGCLAWVLLIWLIFGGGFGLIDYLIQGHS